MVADGLTKPLSQQNFERFVGQLGLAVSGSQWRQRHRVGVLESDV